MAGEVGTAYVSIVPTARGFGGTLGRVIGGDVTKQGITSGKRFGGAFGLGLRGLAGGGIAALGVGALVKSAVGLEADFSQTMNTLAAVTQTPQRQIKTLSDLALKMGADTVFSASDAANAMLELAKGGLTAAQIQAGALKETLTLAAASGVDMATASTIMANAMNTFGLSAKDTPEITAALAGGANASTASIESLGIALQQVGPGAKNAGLTVQETVAALAAFDNAGIKGSDAGTSLKTMLSRLVPQSKRAAGAMRSLGVDFTDAEGNFVPITDVARQLNTALKDVSDAERTSALNKIFGSDATRAASVLANVGAPGLQKYIKATKDMGAAQRVAGARMKGTAGAVEQLKGSFETAQLRVGQLFAPAVQKGAGFLTKGVNAASGALADLSKGGAGGKVSGIISTLQPTFQKIGASVSTMGPPLMGMFKQLAPVVANIASRVGGVLGPAFSDIATLVKTQLVPAFVAFIPAVTPVAKFLLAMFGDALVGALKGVVQVVKAVVTIISGVLNVFAGVLSGDWSRAWNGLKQIVSGVFSGIIGIIKVWWYGGILAIFRRAGAFLVKGLWVGLWNGLKAAPATAFRLINTAISKSLKFLAGIFVKGVRGYFTIWRNIFGGIRQVVGNAMIAARTRVGAVLAGIGKLFATGLRVVIGIVRSVFRAYVTVIREGLTRGVTLFRSLPGRVARALAGLVGKMFKIGNGIIQALIDGIKNKVKDVGGAMKSVGDKIAGFLPGSPVKEGPLTVLNNGQAGGQIAQMLAGGMVKGSGTVARASGVMVGGARFGPRADVRRPGGGGGRGLHVEVHNPIAERASDSVPRAIQRATRAAGWAAA